MNSLRIRNVAMTAAALVLVGLIAGCDPSGKYSDDSGNVSIEFKDGKANMGMAGMTMACDYTVEGDKIIIKSPEGKSGDTITFTRNSDGSLTGKGPLGSAVTLRKK